MGYAALGVAAAVLVGLVVAGARRGRRSWLERSWMTDYRAAVAELGLDEAEQVRLERATRRGEPVPSEQLHAAASFARALLLATPPRSRWRRRFDTATSVVLIASGVLQAVAWSQGGSDGAELVGALAVALCLASVIAVPRFERRRRDRLHRAVDADSRQVDRHQVGDSLLDAEERG